MKGITLIAMGFFAFAACDMQAKLLTAELPTFEVVWFRQLGLFMGVIVLLALRGPTTVLSSRRPGLQIARGLTAAASASFFIFGVQYVPLADATAVSFIAPFVVTVLGALVLREPVGARRWGAVALGFLGMLIVIRPGLGVFHPGMLFVVCAAFCFATRQIMSRWLSGADPVLTTVAYTSITSSLVLSLSLPFVWETPEGWRVWGICAGLTLCAGVGEVLIIRALDIGQAVVLAPVQYSLILWSTFYGFVVFGDLPDHWTFLGCGIIIASGLYTVHRERLRKAKATS
ncbi:transporter [Marinibacterium profundimaris]|uniref:Transporter n=1 Tax=Marinibacterium profundimaris TaxID=1679460 RepID=A0A225ND11_9RHOB|nr:transporter [Marinibacterium profundimaris]